MKELGVTAVELMPMTEFQEVMVRECADGNPYRERELTGKLNYWGYTRSLHLHQRHLTVLAGKNIRFWSLSIWSKNFIKLG